MSEISRVPERVDVCVVGAGSASLSTAIAAGEAGAEVLMLEKAPVEHVGGDLRYCGGFRVVNPAYSEERFYADVMALTRGRADPELTRIMVGESAGMVEWLKRLGVKGDVVPVAGMSFRPEGGCYGLLVRLLSIAGKKGVRILYETKATDLLTDDLGRVVGVRVKKRGDKFRDIRCGAVVLACGGYSANPEMMCKYFDRYAGTMLVRGSRYNTGDGIVMAERVGAKLDFMGDFHGAPEHRDAPRVEGGGCTIRPYRMGLWVNLNGKRFTDEGQDTEDKTYVKVGKEVYAQPGNVAFLIFDEALKGRTFNGSQDSLGRILRAVPGSSDLPADLKRRYEVMNALADKYYRAETIEELAEAIGMLPVSLRQTVDEYNADIREGGGVEGTPCALHVSPPKSGWAYPISHPPYYAYPAVCGITLTFGGPVVDVRGEVLDKEGDVIPGLYAVGALAAGFFYYNYAAGSALTRNVVFGRIAGRSAAGYASQKKG